MVFLTLQNCSLHPFGFIKQNVLVSPGAGIEEHEEGAQSWEPPSTALHAVTVS